MQGHDHMDIQLLSFVLAIILGVVCFSLVKRTADEFDRWYDEQPAAEAKSRLPIATISLLVVFATAAIFVFAR